MKRLLRRPSEAELVILVAFILFITAMGSLVVSRETWNEILSCTRPTGTCAQRNQEQEAAIVAQLQERQAIAVWCVFNNPGEGLDTVRSCIAAQNTQLPARP